MAESFDVRDNPDASQFEVTVDGHLAVSQYRLGDGRIVFTHTEVPAELSGRGVGSALARAALDQARERGLRVEPRCPFVARYIERHPEYADLVHE
ncbi:MAG: GNAT family N-acetyltransferase [Gemmatimonadaceae bacterium]